MPMSVRLWPIAVVINTNTRIKLIQPKSGIASISRIPLRHLRAMMLILLGSDQHFSRDPKITVQFANHRQR